MKVICPISGVPFRTYDSLRTHVAIPHPVFSIPFESLCLILEDIREQEEKEMEKLQENMENQETSVQDMEKLVAKALTDASIEAIHEKNWRNSVFKLYQTKHLVMLALMKQASLLENESGYAARPAPKIIDAFFWQASEIFIWCATLRNPNLIESLPKYRVSRQNEDMGNFAEYLDLLIETKNSVGARYRTMAEERKLQAMEQALAILAKRRNVLNKGLTDSSNHLAAKWALMITRAPKDIYQFWYGILSSKSVNIIFDGVKVDDRIESVTVNDLRELRDWLEDNLIGARGEPKKDHLDDKEYYFIARSTVLNIVRRHIAVVEQGTTFYNIINAAAGDTILHASDDELEKIALQAGLDPKPENLIGRSRFEQIKAMAIWRTRTKQALLDKQEPSTVTESNKGKKKGSEYEIL